MVVLNLWAIWIADYHNRVPTPHSGQHVNISCGFNQFTSNLHPLWRLKAFLPYTSLVFPNPTVTSLILSFLISQKDLSPLTTPSWTYFLLAICDIILAWVSSYVTGLCFPACFVDFSPTVSLLHFVASKVWRFGDPILNTVHEKDSQISSSIHFLNHKALIFSRQHRTWVKGHYFQAPLWCYRTMWYNQRGVNEKSVGLSRTVFLTGRGYTCLPSFLPLPATWTRVRGTWDWTPKVEDAQGALHKQLLDLPFMKRKYISTTSFWKCYL